MATTNYPTDEPRRHDASDAESGGFGPAMGASALDCVLELPRPTKRDVEHAMAGHMLAEATLEGTYKKRGR